MCGLMASRLFMSWCPDAVSWSSSHRMFGQWHSPLCAQDKSKFLIKADIPGVNKEDIKVTTEGDTLSLSVEKTEEKKEEDPETKFHRYAPLPVQDVGPTYAMCLRISNTPVMTSSSQGHYLPSQIRALDLLCLSICTPAQECRPGSHQGELQGWCAQP